MLTTLATLAALAFTQQTDTTVPVRAGARLEINNFGGEIAVKTWSRNAVRVVADHSSRDRISVDASDQLVRVKTDAGLFPPRPSWCRNAPRHSSTRRPTRVTPATLPRWRISSGPSRAAAASSTRPRCA